MCESPTLQEALDSKCDKLLGVASIYDIKPAFQNLLRPITRALASARVTANQVTILAAVLSGVVGVCIAVWPRER